MIGTLPVNPYDKAVIERGEVWWVDLRVSVGTEICKDRPALVISNSDSNNVLERIVIVPLSSNVAVKYPSEVMVELASIENEGWQCSKKLPGQAIGPDQTRPQSEVMTDQIMDLDVNLQQSKAMTDQIMAADKTRFRRPHGTISEENFEDIERALVNYLGLTELTLVAG